MTETATQGGIFGALRKVFKSAKSSVSAAAKLDYVAMALVGFAAVITMAKKAGIDVPGFSVALSMSLGLGALMFEGATMAGMVRSFWRGKLGGVFSNGSIWAFAVTFAFLSWVGAAGQNEAEKTNVHKAAFLESQAVQDNVKMAAQKVMDLRGKVDNMRKAAWESIPTVAGQQITSAAQAQALIDAAKGNGKFWKLTDGCHDAQGPKAREFCKNYGDAVAALADVQKREEIKATLADAEADLKAAEADHKQAKAAAGTTKVVVNESRGEMFLLTDWGGISEKTSEQFSAVFMMVIITIFWSYSWARIEMARMAQEGPRRPFGIIGKIAHAFAMLRWICNGGERPVYKAPEAVRSGPTYVQNTSYTLASDEVSKNIQAIVKCAFEAKAAHG